MVSKDWSVERFQSLGESKIFSYLMMDTLQRTRSLRKNFLKDLESLLKSILLLISRHCRFIYASDFKLAFIVLHCFFFRKGLLIMLFMFEHVAKILKMQNGGFMVRVYFQIVH